MKNMADDRRSLRTRKSLMEALLSLLDEADYDHITIQDIVDRANVGRSTFYAHYEDKDDLLASGFNAMLEKLVEHIELVQNEGGMRFDVTMLFRHAEGHFRLYRALTWGSGLQILTQQGYSGLSSRIEERFASLIKEGQLPGVPLLVVAQHTAGSLLILLKWWLDQKMPYAAEEMNDFFQQLVMPGVDRVLQGGDGFV